ncbi:hypothetical protein EAE96_007381 [Botrytis aclada]|nr:hypothetical protein EAE96_007381 [Botrytis aclada]
MLADLEANKDAILKSYAYSFQKFSHVAGWYKCGKLWSPASPIGSVLNTGKMMVRKEFVGVQNSVKGCDEDTALNAVRKYGIGYVPRPLPEIPPADPGKNKEKRGKSCGDCGSSKTRAKSPPQEKNSKSERTKLPANKLDTNSKAEANPPTQNSFDRGPLLRRAKPLPQENDNKNTEAKPLSKKLTSRSRKPAALGTGGSGATSRH